MLIATIASYMGFASRGYNEQLNENTLVVLLTRYPSHLFQLWSYKLIRTDRPQVPYDPRFHCTAWYVERLKVSCMISQEAAEARLDLLEMKHVHMYLPTYLR